MVENYSEKVSPAKLNLWSAKAPTLTWLDLELTERCNLNCVHCYINLPACDKQAKQRELTTGELKQILTEAASLGCLTVRLTGGEPLLREDFQEIYLFTRKLGIKVLLFTNATLITPDLIDLFVRIPPLEPIEITVYGMRKTSYEAVTRTPESYAASMAGIDLLKKANIPFVVKTTLLPQNKSDMTAFRKWASSIPGMNSEPSVTLFLDLKCRPGNDKNNKAIKKLRLTPNEVLRITRTENPAYVQEMKDFLKHFFHSPGAGLFTCSGDKSICVDSYGQYQLCMMLRHPETIIHYQTCSLKTAVKSFFPKLMKKRAVNQEYLERCGRCFLKSICEQCPAKSYLEYGPLDTPVDYYCEITHTLAHYLGLVHKNEKAWQITDFNDRIEAFITNKR